MLIRNVLAGGEDVESDLGRNCSDFLSSYHHQRSQCLVHGFRSWKDLSHVRGEDNDIRSLCIALGVLPSNTLAEIIVL